MLKHTNTNVAGRAKQAAHSARGVAVVNIKGTFLGWLLTNSTDATLLF